MYAVGEAEATDGWQFTPQGGWLVIPGSPGFKVSVTVQGIWLRKRKA